MESSSRFMPTDERLRPDTSFGSHARRTDAQDAKKAMDLIQSYTLDVFGRINREENIADILEHAIFALALDDNQDRIYSLAAFYDYPNVRGIASDNWEENWWKQTYGKNDQTSKVNAINTLFLHFFVAHPDFSDGCAEELINVTFKALPEVNQIALCVPHHVTPEGALAKFFKLIDTEQTDAPCSVMMCYRKDHFPPLFIRKARVQDNDDLAPLFNQYNEILRQTYGDFFVAELIESQDENNQALVAECHGYAVGFMSISTEVNVDVLNDLYALSAFHGLRAADPNDQWNDQMTEEAEIDLPNSDVVSHHGDTAHHHIKSNPTLDAMHKAMGTSGAGASFDSSHHSSTNLTTTADPHKNHKQHKSQEGPSDHPSVNGSDYLHTPHNKSSEDLSTLHEDGIGGDHNDALLDIADTSSHRAKMTKAQLAAEDPSKFIKPKLSGHAPRFFGREKAFAIQLFCISEVYDKRSYDFLQKAFDVFPDRDYCVISIPQMVPEFPLLQSFIRIPPRVNVPNIQELYLFHRAGLLRDIKVETASEKHLHAVQRLTEHISAREKIINDYLDAVRSRKRNDTGAFLDAHVINVANQTNAVIIFSNEENIDYLRSQYNLEEFIYFTLHRRSDHIHLFHFVINPIFAFMTKLFIKEVLRKVKKTSVYYPIFPRYAEDEVLKHHSPTYAVHYLLPVRPRRLVQYDLQRLDTNAPTDCVLGRLPTLMHNPFALNFTSTKLFMESKITINARIVIVGASTVSMSILEALTMCPYLRFNNLTLISPHGLPGEFPPTQNRDFFLPSNLEYGTDELTRLSLRSYVNIICAKVIGLNRPMKLAILDDDTVVPYDHLLLCTGNQYPIIAPFQTTVISPLSRKPVAAKADRMLFDSSPPNVLTINDEYEAAMALKWLRMHHHHEHSIVIYGFTLEAFCCVNALLTNGIPAQSIKLVYPPNQNHDRIFNDPTVLKTVQEQLKHLQIEVHENFLLDQWQSQNDDDESLPIERVIFRRQEKNKNAEELQLNCTTFFCFYNRQVDYDAFMAINQSSLVFDGRLVIDEHNRTNDTSIYAAGPLTKFKRGYYREDTTHSNFDSKEVGKMLADKIFEQYDPIFIPLKTPAGKHSLIPTFNRPKQVYAVLPGHLHYLQISKPGPVAPYEQAKSIENYGIDITTNHENNYFRLHLDRNGVVRTIVCLHRQKIDAHNLSQLYGLHERLLNNLRQRHKDGLITDLFDYFQENWAVALYHDRFADVRSEVRDVLKKTLMESDESIFSSLASSIDHDMIFTDDQKKSILQRFRTQGYKKEIEEILLRYMNYNQYHLPMYARPN